jgi:flagellar basal body P-ring formation protein FlgA
MRILLALLIMPSLASAESLVALRTIPARAVVVETDFTRVDAEIPGAAMDPEAIVGREARVTVFAGQPILAADFVAPALIDRNQVVPLIYANGVLHIVTEGRALGRAAAGDTVRVMNLASRTTVSGRVTETGAVRVGPETQEE